jgi:hypothetical protein
MESLSAAAGALWSRLRSGDDTPWEEILARSFHEPSLHRSAERLRSLPPADVQLEEAQQAVALFHEFGSWTQLERTLLRVCRGRMPYFVEPGWEHIFSDGVEREVRFVYDRRRRKIVAMQIQYVYRCLNRGTGAWVYRYEWRDAGVEAVEDVTESLQCNWVPEAIEAAARWSFPSFAHPKQLTDRLPRWARAASI